jgi:hypothetical protein
MPLLPAVARRPRFATGVWRPRERQAWRLEAAADLDGDSSTSALRRSRHDGGYSSTDVGGLLTTIGRLSIVVGMLWLWWNRLVGS